MKNLSPFCTCKKLDCPLHPTKHDKCCAPCIAKNLKTKEMPSFYFNLIENSSSRNGDSIEEFAKLILNN